ncbi:DUF72 domain-containing protein [Pullulanibacillus sp. KACC 23026]|uniref:DUF72 domain-containing protein n=1 Tax=Pullulanibacillus sp. KACC 23026 TaxID=3028315 RepID=UPI0023AEA7F9|nr:DUF72 domain-containing protein [Pullulanibacillus sp. KACC 23026]WEG14729.1 DUF72 domain-containing protein [Pullulanibacillus sp. KACC 23026]
MIYIGLTGWGDHPSLYPPGLKAKDKLTEYSSHFLIVEVDTSFYAIPAVSHAEKWVSETPEGFRFVVKAYQGMTQHQRKNEIPYSTVEEMFHAYKESLSPYLESQKLAAVLFQFPPWFDCRRENVAYLRHCKKMMGDIPLALEFRHQSWYQANYREQTLLFMKREGWIHSIADEPQAGIGSVPFVPVAIDPNLTIVRMHGRHVQGWNKKEGVNWRDVRFLYHYSKLELAEMKSFVQELAKDSRDIVVLFNNNSGGDAAENAKEFQHLLGIEYKGLSSKQLDLF